MDNYFLEVTEKNLKNLIKGEEIIQEMYNKEENFEKAEALLEVLMACTHEKQRLRDNLEFYKRNC